MHEPSIDPRWLTPPPPQGSYRSIFKWGAPGRSYHPRTGLVRLLCDRMGLSPQSFSNPQNTGEAAVRRDLPAKMDVVHVSAMADIVGKENVQCDDYARIRYAHGQAVEEILALRHGRPTAAAGVVVHPRHREDVQTIVVYCHAQHIPLTVYGGGSSVTLGVTPARGGVTLVMQTHMRRLLAFNETNRTVTVESGILGPAYEALLNDAPARFRARHRYTGGHFPQSFEFSTVGGWVATLGAGQQSSYYGDIYDLVLGQEVVTPIGTFSTADYPATATGPKVNDIFKGSEGAFGVLTAATLKIFRLKPENRRRFAYLLPGWSQAIAAAREISQGEFGMPSVLRISDPEETEAALQLYGLGGRIGEYAERLLHLKGLLPMKRCLLIGQSDGGRHFARNIARQSSRICRRLGALWLSGYPVDRWSHGRFLDPYMRDDLHDMGVLIDTLETAVTWDRLTQVHAGVRELIKARPQTLCMCHASHFYPQGTNLYFIFMTPMTGVDQFRMFQADIISRILACGGSLSHHHGVGKLMGPWMDGHLGSDQVDVLRALKRHFDPHNIMNPGGTLGLDLP